MAVKIDIGELSEGSQQFELITSPKELGIEDGLVKGKITAELDIFKAPSQLDLNIRVEGLLNLNCDRCLEMYEQPFETAFELVYVHKPAEGTVTQDDYIKIFSPFTKTIDITGDLREYILLAIPMRRVPPEVNDKCSWCGRSNDIWKGDFIDLGEDKFA